MASSKRMRDLRAAKELLTGEWEKQLKEFDEKSEALQAQHVEKTGKIYCDFTVPADEKERCEICKETAQNASARSKVQVEVWDWEARRAKNKQRLSRRVDWNVENDHSAFRGRQRDKAAKKVVNEEALESVKGTAKATETVKATGAWLEEGSLVKLKTGTDTMVILKVSKNIVQVLRDGMIRNYSALNLRPVFDDED